MPKLLFYAAVALMALHGLVHVMGFVAFWPLAQVPDLPYRTALLGGHWEVGSGGMRIFAVLWLLAALGFGLAAGGAALQQPWWRAVLVGTLLLSTALIILDWEDAFRGGIVNVLLLLFLIFASRLADAAFPH